MKKALLSAAPLVGLLSVLLVSPGAIALGFVQKKVICPKSNVTLIPAGSPIATSLFPSCDVNLASTALFSAASVNILQINV